MKITYITRTAVPTTAAQSCQIIAMSKAFHFVLNGKFCLISSGGDPNSSNDFNFTWRPKRVPSNQLFRYIWFCIISLGRIPAQGEGAIYTRDVAIALIVVCFGGRAIFEAHKEPLGRLPSALFYCLSRFRTFKLVVISRALSDYYINKYEFHPDRVLVAHDGVFPEDYKELRKIDKKALRINLGLPIDKFIVVHTGSLARGGAELFEHVLLAGGERVLFIHMGGSKSECTEWSEYYMNRGLSNILFISHQPAAQARLYQVAADLLFYVLKRDWPTHWCASPLKLFEYMASGVPIMGSTVGSIVEIINENNALCYDPDQPQSIQAAWQKFTADPIGSRMLAERACHQAENLYSWYKRAECIARFAADRA